MVEEKTPGEAEPAVKAGDMETSFEEELKKRRMWIAEKLCKADDLIFAVAYAVAENPEARELAIDIHDLIMRFEALALKTVEEQVKRGE